MSKILKGWELLKEIAEGNIKEGTKFKTDDKDILYFDGYNLRYRDINGQYYKESVDDVYFGNCDFEIIEEQEEINIQDIEEIAISLDCKNVDDVAKLAHRNEDKINELIKAIKQLDNEIKESKIDK